MTGTSATLSGLAACSSHTYAVAAFNSAGESARASATGSTSGCPTGGGALAAAPYLYFGWGDPPAPTTVMSATGVKAFTLAFMVPNLFRRLLAMLPPEIARRTLRDEQWVFGSDARVRRSCQHNAACRGGKKAL